MLTVEEAFSSPEKSSTVLCRKLATIEKSLRDRQQQGIALVDDEEIRENKRKIDELQERVSLTADIVNDVTQKMDLLKHQVLINQAKISSNDLIIGGIRVEIEEGEEEDVKAATIKFLENKLLLKINSQELINVSRGKFTTERVIRKKKVTIPPVMFVHTTESVRKLILHNTWKLKKLKDDIDFYGYCVKQSIPEEWRALRAKYQADYDEIKERNLAKAAGEPKEQCYFSQDKFYKHGEVIEECIKPPTPRELINMSAEIHQKVNDIPIICSQLLSEKYSTFRSYAVNVTTVEEVKLAYMQIKKTESMADHIMMAYHFKRETDIQQGSTSNGEHFGDLELLKVLVNHNYVDVMVFCARHYGGILLGRNRLVNIKTTAEEVLLNVNPMTFIPPKEQRPTSKGRGIGTLPKGCGNGGNGGFQGHGTGHPVGRGGGDRGGGASYQ